MDSILKSLINDLKAAMDAFYTLSEIPVFLFDNQYELVLPSPNGADPFMQENSELIHHKDNFMNACKQSHLSAEPCIYKCASNTTEAVLCLKQNEIIVGFVKLGPSIDIDDRQMFAAGIISNACCNYILQKKGDATLFGQSAVKIEQFITQHLKQTINSKMICEYCNISRTTLYELSKKYFNMSISNYITFKRITKAKKLLIESTFSVAEIADECGYDDYAYFSRCFKNTTGVSPKKYRLSNEKENNMTVRLYGSDCSYDNLSRIDIGSKPSAVHFTVPDGSLSGVILHELFGAAGQNGMVQLFKWNKDYSATVSAPPLFTGTIEIYVSKEDHCFMFYKQYPPGEYLLLVSGEKFLNNAICLWTHSPWKGIQCYIDGEVYTTGSFKISYLCRNDNHKASKLQNEDKD